MKTRNRIIISLIVFGIALFGIIHGIVIPKIAQQSRQYIIEQQAPSTHDFKSVLKYRNKYMGNASNIVNLFHSLPLSNMGISFQLFPDRLTAEVNYKETVWGIDEDKVDKALIYNATAAFALIDNLEAVNFNFAGVTYKVLRSDAEKWYGVKMSALIEKNSWEEMVQSKLKDNDYVFNCARAVLQKE